MAGGSYFELTPEETAAINAYYGGTGDAGAPLTSISGAATVAPATTSTSGSGSGSGSGISADDDARRQAAIAAHSGVIGQDEAERANWNWQGNPQQDPRSQAEIQAAQQAEQARIAAQAPVPLANGWDGFAGYETPGSLREQASVNALNRELAMGSASQYWQHGDPMEFGAGAGWDMGALLHGTGASLGGITGLSGGDPMEFGAGAKFAPGAVAGYNPVYENATFAKLAQVLGLSIDDATALRASALNVGGPLGVENQGFRELFPVAALMQDPRYADRVSPEMRQWYEGTFKPQMEDYAAKWEDQRQAQRKASGGFMKFAAPLSVIAPFALGGLGAAGMLGSFGAPAGAALGAGVDAFGAAVPAGFAVAPAATASGLGALAGGLGSLSDIWNAFSGLNPQEKMMVGNMAKMGVNAFTGGDLDPLDMALGFSPVNIGAGLSGMLAPALGNVGGQLGSQFLLNLGKGALFGGDMGEALKRAAIGAGLGGAAGAVGSTGSSISDMGAVDEFGGMGFDPRLQAADWGALAPADGFAEGGDWSSMFSPQSYVNQPGFDQVTSPEDLGANFTSPVTGMLGSLPEFGAPQQPEAPAAAPTPEQAAQPRSPMVAVAQKAVGVLGSMLGDNKPEGVDEAPRRREGQSDQQYQAEVGAWAASTLGLDAQAMAEAGLTPGTQEYMDFILQQADQIIADLGVDPEFLAGASVEQMQQQFRQMTGEQMSQLYRALSVRGQLDQSVTASEGVDPFTGMTEEFGSDFTGNREVAAAQRGVARRAQALGNLRGADARDFLTGMLGNDIDLYDLQARRAERDKLAVLEEEAARDREESERRRKQRNQQRRVSRSDLDRIFGTGY